VCDDAVVKIRDTGLFQHALEPDICAILGRLGFATRPVQCIREGRTGRTYEAVGIAWQKCNGNADRLVPRPFAEPSMRQATALRTGTETFEQELLIGDEGVPEPVADDLSICLL
jgi:hypothetical protein